MRAPNPAGPMAPQLRDYRPGWFFRLAIRLCDWHFAILSRQDVKSTALLHRVYRLTTGHCSVPPPDLHNIILLLQISAYVV